MALISRGLWIASGVGFAAGVLAHLLMRGRKEELPVAVRNVNEATPEPAAPAPKKGAKPKAGPKVTLTRFAGDDSELLAAKAAAASKKGDKARAKDLLELKAMLDKDPKFFYEYAAADGFTLADRANMLL